MSRRARLWLIGGLAFGALLFLYWPLLGQPFIRDDIDIQWTLSRDRSVPERLVLRDLFSRCMLPHFFRPFGAPVFFLFHKAFRLDPAPLRAAILCLSLCGAYLIGRVSAKLSSNTAVGCFSGGLYALSWIHWSGASMTANLPGGIAQVLFWLSLHLFLREDAGRGIASILGSLLPVTVALGFKEDVIVFPVFLLVLGRMSRPLGAVLLAWAGGYLLVRHFLLPNSFLSEASYFHLDRAALLSWKTYADAVALCLEQFRHPVLTRTAWDALAQKAGAAPGRTALWLATAGLAGYACGGCFRKVTLEQIRSGRARVRRGAQLAALSSAGFFAAVLPYAAFAAIGPWGVHRLSLAWGASCIGLGAGAYAASRGLVCQGAWAR
ncbi:MAG: hypothetical protein PHU21_13615, partial [Elusimicrobia bacterium]|nr:hypothetical protein [Elusimicrobiota bacterium]